MKRKSKLHRVILCIERAIGFLNERDRIAVILFANDVERLFDLTPVSRFLQVSCCLRVELWSMPTGEVQFLVI